MPKRGGQPGNPGGGRKSLKEELSIVSYYERMLPQAFKVAEKFLNSNNKADQRFALDWYAKGFARMIPQKLGGDPDNQTPIPIYNAKSIKG